MSRRSVMDYIRDYRDRRDISGGRDGLGLSDLDTPFFDSGSGGFLDGSLDDLDGPRGEPCWKTHPRLIAGRYFVTGGSARYPSPSATVRVQLEEGRTPEFRASGTPLAVSFPIRNMRIPDLRETRELLSWLCGVMKAGDEVHIGCVGGHGRTGTIIACMHHMLDPSDEDRVEWVRREYCRRAVEGFEQESFVREFCSTVDKYTDS